MPFNNTLPQFSCPAVSVVIPMYNAEKYICDCLDSLLAQTLKNFEVIVVDDCSTDSSCAIVESYTEKFGGRLKLAHMKKNTGSGGFPRNKGIELSRGEYIFNMDNDDSITPTALEELYTQAKKYDADVVHCEKFFHVPDEFSYHSEFRKHLKPSNYLTGEKVLITEPLVWENNFEERIKFLGQRKLIWNIWNQLIRRDFIVNNEIQFWDLHCDDMLFTICELCCAKRYVLLPNVIYYYRQSKTSIILNMNRNLPHFLNLKIKALKTGIRYIDEFLSEREFFSRRPDLKYILFETFANEMLGGVTGIYVQVPAPALDAFLQKEFSDGNHKALTTFLFSTMNVYRLQLIQSQQRIAQLENEIKSLKG